MTGLEGAGHFASVDALRDRILGLKGVGESGDWDWSVVSQADLLDLGRETPAEGIAVPAPALAKIL